MLVPAHDPPPDLPAPRRRSPNRGGRGPVYDIRRASGLPLRARVQRQTERDQLAHHLAAIDREMEALGRARLAAVEQLARLRDDLYPPIPWCHGRRPPDLDTAPLPPAPEGSQALTGRALRAACLELVGRFGPLPLRQLHGLLHHHGYVIGSARPVQALSDALRHEVQAGRARRVRRGVYTVASSERGRATPLDPALDEDPHTWPPGLPPPCPTIP